MRQVFEAAAHGVRILPIVAEESFRVPQDWLAECQTLPSQFGEYQWDAADVAFVMEAIFKTIAVDVHPQDSEEALDVRGRTTAKRLNTGTVAVLSDECRMKSRQMCADFLRQVVPLEIQVGATNVLPCLQDVLDEGGGEEAESLEDVVLDVLDDIGLLEEVNGSCVLPEHKSLTAIAS